MTGEVGAADAERARPGALDVSRALREVTTAAAELDRALTRALHLRPLDYAALNHVMTAPRPPGPAEVGTRLGISSGSATELVDRLEHAGHLRRERDPADRRRVGLHATESAVEEVRAALGPVFAALAEEAERLSGAEREVVTGYLGAVAARLRAFAADTPDHRTDDRPAPPPRRAR